MPLPATAALARAVAAAGTVARRLPPERTPLIGRERDVAGALDALARTRLLTIVGAPGIGKTRLAVRLASDAAPRFANGTCFVDASGATDSASLERTCADALHRLTDAVEGERPAARAAPLERALANAATLIVLDNCEHLILGCAALAARVLAASPSTRLIATSRRPLAVAGETLWRLRTLADADAARLFVERLADARGRTPETPRGRRSPRSARTWPACRSRSSLLQRRRVRPVCGTSSAGSRRAFRPARAARRSPQPTARTWRCCPSRRAPCCAGARCSPAASPPRPRPRSQRWKAVRAPQGRRSTSWSTTRCSNRPA